MEAYISFLLEQWVWSGIFVVLLVLLLANEWRNRGLGIKMVSPQDLVNLLNHDKGVVLDIRAQTSFENGHILGAVNIPENDLESKKKQLNKYRTKPIIVVCQNGAASAKVGRNIMKQGFEQVYCLQGGLDSWKSENLPISKH